MDFHMLTGDEESLSQRLVGGAGIVTSDSQSTEFEETFTRDSRLNFP
jgi:hypothetical protein